MAKKPIPYTTELHATLPKAEVIYAADVIFFRHRPGQVRVLKDRGTPPRCYDWPNFLRRLRTGPRSARRPTLRVVELTKAAGVLWLEKPCKVARPIPFKPVDVANLKLSALHDPGAKAPIVRVPPLTVQVAQPGSSATAYGDSITELHFDDKHQLASKLDVLASIARGTTDDNGAGVIFVLRRKKA